MRIQFKKLKSDQIEVRPTDTKVQGSATLLLYIDSRSAADILNESVGELNWQIEYKPVGDKVYGRLSIWDEERKMWIYKEDTGDESNISAGKGLSSDILKRCLARWGCDYLYHTPRIKIQCPDNYYYNEKLSMTFSVKEIDFNDDKVCTRLVIVDRYDKVVFNWTGNEIRETPQKPSPVAVPVRVESISITHEGEAGSPMKILEDFCARKKTEEGINQRQLESFFRFWSKKVQEGWSGTFKPGLLWERWMERAYQ